MSRWFRHYAGLCRDEKLVSVAIKSKQPIERVVWVWCAILESAAEIDDDGQYRLDTAEVAYFLRSDEADICAIVAGLGSASRVHSGAVVKWGDRQFKSDKSASRVAAYRERKRAVEGDDTQREPSRNGDVTLQTRYGNAPETETELETELEKEEPSVLERVAAPKPAPKVKGSRLSSDWKLSADDRKAALAEGMPEAQVDREANKFRDYWTGRAGANGVKLDWSATWRNWVRRACEDRGWTPDAQPMARAGPPQPPAPNLPTDAELRAKWAAALAIPEPTDEERWIPN